MLKRSKLKLVDNEDIEYKFNITVNEEKKYKHPPFIKKCVASITKNSDKDTSSAFAICQSQYKKGNKKSLNNRAIAKGNYSARMRQYKSALKDAREKG